MLRRALLPVTGVAAAVPLVVAAETTDAPAQTTAKANTKSKVKPSELPIYGEPSLPEFDYIPEEMTGFRKNVSVGRRAVWEFMDKFQDTTEKVKKTYEGVKNYTSETVAYIQKDSGDVQRAAIITVAGLGGVVAGYKGGALRKASLASAAMLTTAAICYPNQAVDISRRGWQTAKDQVTGSWKPTPSKAKETKPKPAETKAAPEAAKVKDTVQQAEKEQKHPDKSQMDFGQSKPEDKDMYTTRGS